VNKAERITLDGLVLFTLLLAAAFGAHLAGAF